MRELAEVLMRDLPAELVDVDVTTRGSFVGITAIVERRTVRHEGREILRPVRYREQRLLFGPKVLVDLPVQCSFPIVRAIGEETALVVDRNNVRARVNAWILDHTGRLVTSFCAGDGVQDVVICNDRIAITYFDEGIFGHVPPSPEGVAIFDAAGTFQFGYHGHFGHAEASIADCYAACADEYARLLIFPYTDFPIVRIDLTARTRELFVTADSVRGARALSSAADQVFLWSPYKRRNEVLRLWLGKEGATSVGTYSAPLRGLPGGRFISCGASGYKIISVLD